MFGVAKFGTALFGFIGGSEPPIVSAGNDRVAAVEAVAFVLSGSVTDSDSVSTTLWSFISGPNTPTIVNPANLTTPVTGLVDGTYVFRLTANDGTNTVYDEMSLLVPKRKDKGISNIFIQYKGLITESTSERKGVVIESVF